MSGTEESRSRLLKAGFLGLNLNIWEKTLDSTGAQGLFTFPTTFTPNRKLFQITKTRSRKILVQTARFRQ